MPLGQEIGAMAEAVRDRIEVSSHGRTWHVTAGSFDGALVYCRERFDRPVVLSRSDRGRWWPRVTLVVTEDRSFAASAPSLDDLADPGAPAGPAVDTGPEVAAGDAGDSDMPAMLEEMFARQASQDSQDRGPAGAHRVPRQRRSH